MHSRCLIAAFTAVALAGSAAAEPVKPAVDPSAQPAKDRPAAEVVLASAEQVRTPALTDAQPATPAKKPRAARVTSCRCAGQVPESNR